MNNKLFQLFRRWWNLFLLVCFTAATASFAQDSNSPPVAGAAGPISVSFISPRDGAKFHAMENIHIFTWLSPRATFSPGDSAKVELFVGTNSLGSRTSFYHGQQGPQNRPGQFNSMIVVGPGFSSVEWTWTNAPLGAYVLTAKATYLNGPAVVSKPMNITVTSSAATGHQ